MLAFRPGLVPRALPPSHGCIERRDAASAEPRDHGTSWAVGSVGFIMVSRLTRFTRLTRRAVLEAPTVAIPGAKVQDETRQKRADQCLRQGQFVFIGSLLAVSKFNQKFVAVVAVFDLPQNSQGTDCFSSQSC